MKIFITGGSGTLGTELVKLINKQQYEVYTPSSREVDITNYEQISNFIKLINPDILIHCAAYTDVKKSEIEVIKCMETNVVGTFNIIKSINENNIKLVHISTEHVFDGEKGDYTTTDLINPITKYAKSKAAAEIIATMYSNSLIIRTSFYSHTFPYEKAFTDQWTTKDYIDIIAPKILKLALSDKKGIYHCCSKKRTIYDIAKIRNPNVKPFTRSEIKFPTPKDTSLICTEE